MPRKKKTKLELEPDPLPTGIVRRLCRWSQDGQTVEQEVLDCSNREVQQVVANYPPGTGFYHFDHFGFAILLRFPTIEPQAGKADLPTVGDPYSKCLKMLAALGPAEAERRLSTTMEDDPVFQRTPSVY